MSGFSLHPPQADSAQNPTYKTAVLWVKTPVILPFTHLQSYSAYEPFVSPSGGGVVTFTYWPALLIISNQ